MKFEFDKVVDNAVSKLESGEIHGRLPDGTPFREVFGTYSSTQLVNPPFRSSRVVIDSGRRFYDQIIRFESDYSITPIGEPQSLSPENARRMYFST